jgi:hypothetical protein
MLFWGREFGFVPSRVHHDTHPATGRVGIRAPGAKLLW